MGIEWFSDCGCRVQSGASVANLTILLLDNSCTPRYCVMLSSRKMVCGHTSPQALTKAGGRQSAFRECSLMKSPTSALANQIAAQPKCASYGQPRKPGIACDLLRRYQPP